MKQPNPISLLTFCLCPLLALDALAAQPAPPAGKPPSSVKWQRPGPRQEGQQVMLEGLPTDVERMFKEGSTLYFLTAKGELLASKSFGTLTSVRKDLAGLKLLPHPGGFLAVSADTIYRLTDKATEKLVGPRKGLRAVTISGTNVLWLEEKFNHCLRRMPIAGGDEDVLLQDLGPTAQSYVVRPNDVLVGLHGATKDGIGVVRYTPAGESKGWIWKGHLRPESFQLVGGRTFAVLMFNAGFVVELKADDTVVQIGLLAAGAHDPIPAGEHFYWTNAYSVQRAAFDGGGKLETLTMDTNGKDHVVEDGAILWFDAWRQQVRRMVFPK